MREDTATESRTENRPRGRKDRTKQEAVVKIDGLEDKIDELVRLHHTHCTAAEDLNAAIKAVAEQTGLMASVVRKFVTARAGENFGDKKREAEQLAFVFEEIGE